MAYGNPLRQMGFDPRASQLYFARSQFDHGVPSSLLGSDLRCCLFVSTPLAYPLLGLDNAFTSCI
jgi:hypothetical protein